MAGRRGKRGRSGARGGRGGTRGGISSNQNIEGASPDKEDEPQAKIPKEEAAGEGLPDLLKQPKEILINIINKLDPNSFHEFAYSCKALYHFCFNTKGIAVVFPLCSVNVSRDKAGSITYYSNNRGCDAFEKYLQRLRTRPFVLHIDRLYIYSEWNGDQWKQMQLTVKKFFAESRVKEIRSFSHLCPTTAEEVEQINKEFIKVFKIKKVNFRIESMRNQKQPEKEAIGACLKLPLVSLKVHDLGGELHVDQLLDCSIPFLDLGMSLPLTAMDTIMQIWKTKNLVDWEFKYHCTPTKFTDYFNRHDIRFFNYRGPIDRNKPPIFMEIKGGSHDSNFFFFYIVRKDGKVFRVSVGSENHYFNAKIKFHMCPNNEIPLALRDL